MRQQKVPRAVVREHFAIEMQIGGKWRMHFLPPGLWMGGTTVRPSGDHMSHPVIRDYLRVAAGDDPTGPADVDLLARFAATRDEAAFELLVWRHAGLIQRVCQGVLGDHHAAEDAAQAAFLILARKAHTFAGHGSVVGWLYRIARRVAFRLAKDRSRREAASTGLDRIPAVQSESTASSDEVEALCAEVDRLPARYRVPVLLCFFEGLTHMEAARRTGWAIGTVAGRLARAKDLLARRLTSKGVGVTTVVLALPAGNFVGNTARAAVAFSVRGAVVPGVEPSIYHLAEGVLNAMITTKLKLVATGALVCIAAAGTWGLTVVAAPQSPTTQALPSVAQPPTQPPQPSAEERLRNAAQWTISKNNLKQIMLAMYNYYEVNGHFPQNITDKDGKPLLSWRVAILPFIEQSELYEKFKLAEPWDSESNKKLLAAMPKLYGAVFATKNDTKTYYQVFAGTGTPFEPGKKVRLVDITDGTSNTLGVVEAGPPVEWSKPADIPYDPKQPLPKIEKPFKTVFNVAVMDGSVRSFRPDLEEKLLRLLIESADGVQVPPLKKFEATLPLTKEDIDLAQVLMKQNEALIDAIAEQLRVQQKLLLELGKKNLTVEGFNPEGLKLHEELEGVLKKLKTDTKQLQKQVEALEKK
jgi:RNA polymerase sigma factor (sigma-70 family)